MRYTRVFLFMAVIVSSACSHINPEEVTDKKDGLLIMKEWGLMDMDPAVQNASRIAAKKFGFKYVTIGGCTLGWSESKAAEKHNAKVESILAERHGSDWKKKLDIFYNEEFKKDSELISLIISDSSLIKEVRIKSDSADYFYYDLEPENGNKYSITIEGNDGDTTKHGFYAFKKVIADFNTKKILPLDSPVEKIDD